MATTPGNMKVRKSMPPVVGTPLLTRDESPVPSTKRKSTGWTSEVMIRSRLRLKRMSSRRHTTRTARRSSFIRPPATRTAAGVAWGRGAPEGGPTGGVAGDPRAPGAGVVTAAGLSPGSLARSVSSFIGVYLRLAARIQGDAAMRSEAEASASRIVRPV